MLCNWLFNFPNAKLILPFFDSQKHLNSFQYKNTFIKETISFTFQRRQKRLFVWRVFVLLCNVLPSQRKKEKKSKKGCYAPQSLYLHFVFKVTERGKKSKRIASLFFLSLSLTKPKFHFFHSFLSLTHIHTHTIKCMCVYGEWKKKI